MRARSRESAQVEPHPAVRPPAGWLLAGFAVEIRWPASSAERLEHGAIRAGFGDRRRPSQPTNQSAHGRRARQSTPKPTECLPSDLEAFANKPASQPAIGACHQSAADFAAVKSPEAEAAKVMQQKCSKETDRQLRGCQSIRRLIKGDPISLRARKSVSSRLSIGRSFPSH